MTISKCKELLIEKEIEDLEGICIWSNLKVLAMINANVDKQLCSQIYRKPIYISFNFCFYSSSSKNYMSVQY